MFFESGGAKYDYDQHQQQVAELLAQAVERYKEAQKSYPRTIAIHYYKRFGRAEKERIIAAIGGKVPSIQIAFITIDSSHPMRLYDLGIRMEVFRDVISCISRKQKFCFQPQDIRISQVKG